MATLVCSVRDCGRALVQTGRTMVCERGHSFDVARSGYVNLLQPQDARSRTPGDSAETVAARQRFLDGGYESHVVDSVVSVVASLLPRPHASILDVGSGSGHYLAAIAASLDLDAHGLDISATAVDRAARSQPTLSWVVANADRRIPYASGSFDVVLSVTSRRNRAEFHRILTPGGALVVVIPAADDLVELREIVLGAGVAANRLERVVADLAEEFAFVRHVESRGRVHLEPDAARDALLATYRGVRSSQRERTLDLAALEVTLAREILVFEAR
jgi:23S rRNA (guanine745-N1)-methyltransferase